MCSNEGMFYTLYHFNSIYHKIFFTNQYFLYLNDFSYIHLFLLLFLHINIFISLLFLNHLLFINGIVIYLKHINGFGFNYFNIFKFIFLSYDFLFFFLCLFFNIMKKTIIFFIFLSKNKILKSKFKHYIICICLNITLLLKIILITIKTYKTNNIN